MGVRLLSLPNTKSRLRVLAGPHRYFIEVSRVDYGKLNGDRMGETSEALRKRVQATWFCV